jgi:enamine deaminase RidA (YjgF/YER057c/UK114 family)
MNDVIRTDRAPRPVGAYPHARRVGNLLFLSGIGRAIRHRMRFPVTFTTRTEN